MIARYDPEHEETLDWRVAGWVGVAAEGMGIATILVHLFHGGPWWHVVGITLTLAGALTITVSQLGARLRLRRFSRRRHRIP